MTTAQTALRDRIADLEQDDELDEYDPDYTPNPPYDLPEGDWQ